MSEPSESMEAVAQRVVNYLYEELRTPTGEPACSLVRFFKTHLYGELEPELQRLMLSKFGQQKANDELICLTLLATQGEEQQWRDRRSSAGHQVIPLFSAEAIEKIPMISEMIAQLGLTPHELIGTKTSSYLEKLDQKTYNVFHIGQARGSEFIPRQTDFVIPYDIQSVIAFGGMLPNGELFTVILFSKVYISEAIARLFDPLALSVKLSILPFGYNAVFSSQSSSVELPIEYSKQALKSEVNTLRQLLCVSENTALRQSHYLEKSIQDLIIAKQAAEAASIAKSAFLSTMSHEIRTPMNAVIGLTDLLLDTSLSSQQEEFVEIIRNSGNTLMDIINDILDFSKIDAGKIEIESTVFNLRECFERTIDLFVHTAQEKKIELIFDWRADTAESIRGDVTRIRQILINLLSNAFKFTTTGEIVLSVSLLNTKDTAETQLLFSVQDTGVGIPPERKDRLFKAFSQVDSSTTRKYGGTGLGLAISQRLAGLMGGSIWVESEIGYGSTFFCQITAPLVSQKASPPSISLQGKQVLIVDDSQTLGEVLTEQLVGWGAEAIATQDPQQAIHFLQDQRHFDLVIIDRQMPDLDGICLAIELRQFPIAQNIPFILLSSQKLSESKMLKQASFDAVLNKPIKPNIFIDHLHRIFDNSIDDTAKIPVNTENKNPIDSELSTLKILIAEDNIVNQKVAVLTLQKLGYKADIANNGKEVIEVINEQNYDLILMDVQMPELDGLQTTEWIRQKYKGIQPKIIAITANAEARSIQECLNVGMDSFLTKPIRCEDIKDALNKIKEQL
ncbi:response regulator [[Leptolyngbya] sp. PCC 7376]|uniref:response regulator n=1 Tax=[Leptolyngbya] sp. PCC 7376 TaxID=111781 RepID=UPI00135B3572|nr:response regulator [[Leptolyngbya] sp. PCC 7376]